MSEFVVVEGWAGAEWGHPNPNHRHSERHAPLVHSPCRPSRCPAAAAAAATQALRAQQQPCEGARQTGTPSHHRRGKGGAKKTHTVSVSSLVLPRAHPQSVRGGWEMRQWMGGLGVGVSDTPVTHHTARERERETPLSCLLYGEDGGILGVPLSDNSAHSGTRTARIGDANQYGSLVGSVGPRIHCRGHRWGVGVLWV